jgi:glycosyltransferase involved in cell wall biosynthesis
MASNYEIATVLPPSEHFTPGAAGALALFAYEAARDSAYKDHITVYGRSNEKTRPFSGVRYRGIEPSMELLFGRNGGYARALAHYLKERPTGLIEVHNRVQIFNILAKAFPNLPMAMHFHNDPLTIKGSQTPKQRWELLARADAIYCCSEFIRRRFLTGLEAGRTDHVHVVYHGIDAIKHSKKESVILYVGRLIEEKGALELAQAAQILLPHFPNWKIAFVGATRHGGQNASPYARAVIDALKPLGKQAVMMGHQPHEKTLRLYAKAAIAVVPSTWNEPLGRTAIEAMAAGCALVTSGHGGLAEIAGDAGVIVDPVTPEGLALALQGLIEDPETLRHIQQMCVTRAPLFSLQSVQHQLDGLRYQLLGQAYGG